MPSRNSRPSDAMKKKDKAPTEEGVHVTKKQVLVQENGDVVIVTPPEFRAATIRDTALALLAMGKKGIPLHDDDEALEARHTGAVDAVLADNALLALALLEAIHRGDPAPLRAIADAMKAAEKAEGKPVERDPIHKAVARAARKAGRVPTEEQARDAYVEIGREKQGGVTPRGGAFDRSDKFHEMLEGRGIDLEKEIRRGDHLRRKSPK